MRAQPELFDVQLTVGSRSRHHFRKRGDSLLQLLALLRELVAQFAQLLQRFGHAFVLVLLEAGVDIDDPDGERRGTCLFGRAETAGERRASC